MRRIRPEPIALRFRADSSIYRVGNAVPECFVEAADGVVPVGHIEHVIRRPPVIEAMRPYARHAAFRHLFNLVVRKQIPFVDHDRIQPGVVWPSTCGGVEKGHRLMQIVQDCGMVFEKRFHLIA